VATSVGREGLARQSHLGRVERTTASTKVGRSAGERRAVDAELLPRLCALPARASVGG